MPRFPAEHFGRVRLQDTRYKQFDEGLRQLEEEGLMQVFYVTSGRREPIVGVVGALQFDVIASRLRSEYGVEVQIEPTKYTSARWLAPGAALPPLGGRRAERRRRRPPGAARPPVRIGVGAAVLPAPAPGRRAALRVSCRDRRLRPDVTSHWHAAPSATIECFKGARHGRTQEGI